MPVRPRPRGQRPVQRWKPVNTLIASGLGLTVIALLFVLVRSAQYAARHAPPTTDFALVAYQGQDVIGTITETELQAALRKALGE